MKTWIEYGNKAADFIDARTEAIEQSKYWNGVATGLIVGAVSATVTIFFVVYNGSI